MRNVGSQRWIAFGDHQGCYGLKLISRLRAQDGVVIRAEGTRTYLSGIIAPRELVTVPLVVEAPASAGDYSVEATLLQECVDWFDARGSRPAVIALTVR
ncbi:MAG TPA: hypothetical protein VGV61_10755 [Thermoanaerobaculia bacterium]|nr:hypothetical protein [Thermoanaerobaculia bacterium]